MPGRMEDERLNMKIILIVLAVCLFVMLALMAFAPEGYEDEKGFHYGKK